MPTNNDGFPDGTTIVTTPPTCADPGTYVVPPCAHSTEHIYIPLQYDQLPETGGEIVGLYIAVIIILAGMLLITYWMWRNRDRRFVSLDCQGGQHNACTSTGACDGCQCHEVNQ